MKIIKTAAYTFSTQWKTTLDQAIAYAMQSLDEPWMASLNEYDRDEKQSQDMKEQVIREAVEDWMQHQRQSLKTPDGNIPDEFKSQVQSHVMSKYNVDPFPGLIDTMQAPSPEDLDEQWR